MSRMHIISHSSKLDELQEFQPKRELQKNEKNERFHLLRSIIIMTDLISTQRAE